MAEFEQAKFTLQVKPNARQNQLMGFKEGVLHVRVAAPPVEGKANSALIKFLAGQLGVPKSSVVVEHGLSGKTKTVIILGLSRKQAMDRLETPKR